MVCYLLRVILYLMNYLSIQIKQFYQIYNTYAKFLLKVQLKLYSLKNKGFYCLSTDPSDLQYFYCIEIMRQNESIFKNTLIWQVNQQVLEAIQQLSLILNIFVMQNRKSKKRTLQQSLYSKPASTSVCTRFNIKFDFVNANLSCFIGQKRQNKKTLSKGSQSHKMRKSSQRKRPVVVEKQRPLVEKSKEKKRQQQSPDIVRDSSNSILLEIQNKGIKHQWRQPEQITTENTHSENCNQNMEIWNALSVNQSLEKSYASTMDYQQPAYYYSADYNNESFTFQSQQRSQSFQWNSFDVRMDEIGFDPRTTIMIRNIPNKYTIKELSAQIDYCFDSTYDFLYLPCDLKNQCNVGYGFINFVNTVYLRDFYVAFHNRKWAKFRSQKICILTYARLQGLNSLIQHFQNSKVLNAKEKRYRPIIKQNAKINNLIKTQQQR